MNRTWADVRPGDVVSLPGGTFTVTTYAVSTGIFTLVDANGKEWPGKPNLSSEVNVLITNRITPEEVAEGTGTTLGEVAETLVSVVLGGTLVGERDTTTGEWTCPRYDTMTPVNQAAHLLFFHGGSRNHSELDFGVVPHTHGEENES